MTDAITTAIIGLTHRVTAYRAIRRIESYIKMGAIDRLKEKTLTAKQIVPQAVADYEADLDTIIAQGPVLEQKRKAAVKSHMDTAAGIISEIDGLKQVMSLLSNGGPPLSESPPAPPLSVPDLAANRVTPEEHIMALQAGKIAESKEYYEYISALKAQGK